YQGHVPGGQLTTTTEVDNFPGYTGGVSGPEMMEHFKAQALRFNADIRWGMITSVDFSGEIHKAIVDNKKIIEADVVLISTGASAKYLGLESERKFLGSGVSACATCDGFFYKEKTVAVVGGGDTACEEATYLSGLCKKVYMIIRTDKMKASKFMQERVNNRENIEVLYNHSTKEIVGDSEVNGAILLNKAGEEKKIEVDGFFVAIGHKPNSDVFKTYIDTDDNGYIITKPGSSHTNVKGVFACGDVQDPHYRQAVTAAGSGSQAAIDAERYLMNK
ncbi:NAD(P)/FAD-dependent oxidoreductase, partial [Bacteroidota bacterium]